MYYERQLHSTTQATLGSHVWATFTFFYETIKHFISFIIMLTDDGLCENNMLILWKKPRLSSVSQLIHKQTAKTTTESTFM